jgi:hypothetical protein
VYGIGALAERLGPIMGVPLECEHVDPATGYTIQRTTTGLAIYQPASNRTTFSVGSSSYILADGQVLLWRGSGDPPQLSGTEVAYLSATAPFRDRLDDLHAHLAQVQEAAVSGSIDGVPSADITTLAGDFWAARQVFAATRPSIRLDRYDQIEKVSLAQAFDASDLLLRARVADSAPDRDDLVRRAAIMAESSRKLHERAREELTSLVPVVLP